MEKLVKFFATGFGLGYSPFASGTVGTLPALFIVIPLASMGYGMQLAITAISGPLRFSLVQRFRMRSSMS